MAEISFGQTYTLDINNYNGRTYTSGTQKSSYISFDKDTLCVGKKTEITVASQSGARGAIARQEETCRDLSSHETYTRNLLKIEVSAQ